MNRNILFLWKDQFLRNWKTRHRIIKTAAIVLTSQTDALIIPWNVGVTSATIINWQGNKSENIKALRYLLANGYLKSAFVEDIDTIFFTQKGIDAFNSEYFLLVFKEQIRLRNNNRWLILFNGIIAFGVVYSIWKDDIKKFLSSKEKEKGLSPYISPVLGSLKTPICLFRLEKISFDSMKPANNNVTHLHKK